MTDPAVSLCPRPSDRLGEEASAEDLLALAGRDDFHSWQAQLAATGHCAHPVRLSGRIDAIDRATGERRNVYDTRTEPGGVLRIACGNRREDICPACSATYKNDARQIIRSGLTGGKGMPETVTEHPCVFATLTAPGFGPVHTTRTDRHGRTLPCRPRRDRHQRRCPHGRDISCPVRHLDGDPRLGQPLCPDCYDYTGHILFNACGPDLWRRFIVYLPRQLARLARITHKQLRAQVSVRFVKVTEYQARGIIHYHAIIRLDSPGQDWQPPPSRYDTAMLRQAIRQAATVVSIDTAAHLSRLNQQAAGSAPGDTGAIPVIGPQLARILRFGTQLDTRTIRPVATRPARNRQSALCPGGSSPPPGNWASTQPPPSSA